MKKYKLSLTLGTVFLSFLILLMHEMLSVYWKYLPIVMFSALIVLTLGLLWDGKRTKQSTHEAYAPKHFAQLASFLLVTIAITVMCTVILHKPHFSKTFDLTTNHINSLSPETETFLKSLETDVQVICIPGQNLTDTYCDSSLEIVKLYEKQNNHIINLGTLDLTDRNLLARIQPSGFSRLILMSETNKSEISGDITESKFTNALINLIKFKKTVYFLTGHGEPSLTDSTSDRNYIDVSNQLESKAYTVEALNLQHSTIPEDARMIVAGDNTITYDLHTESQLIDFVATGGRLILIANPYREQGLHKMYALLNLKPDNVLLVLDKKTAIGRQIAKQNLLRPPVIMSDFSVDSPITSPIALTYGADASIPIDGARPFTPLDSETARIKTDTEVLMSAVQAVPVTLTEAERNKINLDAPSMLIPDKNVSEDAIWPIGFDIQISNASHLSHEIKDSENPEDDKSEVVVYGFSLVNEYSQSVRVTEELLTLTVAKLYEDKDVLNIPARDFVPKQFNLSRNPGAWVLLFAGVLPVATALIGVFIWFRRRNA